MKDSVDLVGALIVASVMLMGCFLVWQLFVRLERIELKMDWIREALKALLNKKDDK